MKKLISLILAAMMLLASAAAAQGAHTHQPTEGWDRDVQKHWRVCECGEVMEEEEHTLDDMTCTVCGSMIWDFGDGYYVIDDYDEFEDLVRSTNYGPDGSATDDYVYQITRDENGCRIHIDVYWNGMLIEAAEYRPDEEGYSMAVRQTHYDPDGGMSVTDYDQHGNISYSVSTDADGAMRTEETYEYDYSEDGWVLETRYTIRFAGGDRWEHKDNDRGDNLLTAYYNVNGELEYGTRSEYGWDEAGCRTDEKTYDLITGQLLNESIYDKTDETRYGIGYYRRYYKSYEEDGSRYEAEYDQDGNELTETFFNAGGEAETVYRNEYEFDENGNILLHTRYENDRVCLICQYEIVEDDGWAWAYEAVRTEISGDGSMYIVEYDEMGDEISAGWFDKDGNPMSEKEVHRGKTGREIPGSRQSGL